MMKYIPGCKFVSGMFGDLHCDFFLIKIKHRIITSGARSAERVLLVVQGRNLSMRGPTRPDPTPSRFSEAYISGTG